MSTTASTRKKKPIPTTKSADKKPESEAPEVKAYRTSFSGQWVKNDEKGIGIGSITVKQVSPLPQSAWLQVTSLKTGWKVFVPLPIRLIQQIPDEKGGGCLIRGAHGDETTSRENIVEVLGMLNGYSLTDAACWSLAE